MKIMPKYDHVVFPSNINHLSCQTWGRTSDWHCSHFCARP